VAEAQSKWGLRQGTRKTSERSRLSHNLNGSSSLTDEAAILQYLKDLAVTGSHKLDGILRAVVEAAQRKTGASGAAVAMWKDGAMVCRARSGETAPPLGAKLSSDTGISGECLRTGQTQHCADTENDPRVDVEVCRTLGLRSIAVLPIQGWRGINGILEVFSTEAGAFSQADLAFLQQLAAVAERARTFQPQGATGIPKTPIVEEPQVQGILPASDRVRDVAAIFFAGRSRPFVIGGAVIAMFLLGVAVWLGWRGPAEASPATQSVPAVVSKVEAARPLDKDPIWAEHPGGEALTPQKTPAGIPVKMASDVEVIAPPKAQNNQPLLTADAAAMSVAPHHAAPPSVEESLVVAPPSLPPTNLGSAALGPLLGSSVSSPQLSKVAVSQGVSGGRLTQRLPPTYPAQALLMRLQGKVILEGTIFEDGTLHDLNVVQGHPVLAKSAVRAVERWRYTPYQLDGRPVRRQTTITVEFKLPADAPSR
jgi:TonB family protein